MQTLRTLYFHWYWLPWGHFGVILSIIKSASDIPKSNVSIVAVSKILAIQCMVP